MKMSTAYVVAALAVSAAANAHAADAGKALVMRDWTDIVAPAQQAAYEAGQKAFAQCLREHRVKFSLPAVTHETGNTYAYSYDVGPITWAGMDALDAESKPCLATWIAQGNPHLMSETSAFMVLQPDLSHLPANWASQPTPPILHVVDFTLKPGHAAYVAFGDALKKIAAAAGKTHWPYYWNTMQIQAGGEGSPDYVLVIAGKNWADIGPEADPPLWKMVANADGQADADATRKSFNAAVGKSSDHFDRYNASLSYIAGK